MININTARRPLVALVALACLATLGPQAAAQDAEIASTGFRFRGRGWGHGLGMSQWGSKGLADDGWSATQILAHFYAGTELGTHSAPSTLRVGLVQKASRIRVKPDGTIHYHAEGKKVRTVGVDQIWTATPAGGGRVLLTGPDGDELGPYDGPVLVRFEPNGSKVRLLETDRRYRWGSIQLDAYDVSGQQRMRAVLTVPFEKYVYGIGEVPSSWPVASLRAQAIAARTYALEKALRLGQRRSGCDCAVYASTIDQAYVGYEKEAGPSGDRWVDAADDTAGLVVLSGGDPVQALYSSSSGGHTEDNEKQWGGTAIGYLRGRCDPGDYADGSNPNSNWAVDMTESEVRSKLAAGGVEVGPITKITYLPPRGVSGRVTQVVDETKGGVRVTGSTGTARLSGDRFRSLLGLKTNLLGPWMSGEIRARWDALSCKPGSPESNEYTWKSLDGSTWGRAQDFKVGRLFLNTSTGRVLWNRGAILAKYDDLREAGTDIGGPASNEYSVDGGRAVNYERGRIYWSSKYGAHVVYGSILKRYLAFGGPASSAGLPVTDEAAAGSGRSSSFQRAKIYWGPSTGTRLLKGPIVRKYVAVGGPDKVGLPTTEEYRDGGARAVGFEKANIYRTSSTGAHVVGGGILAKYLDLGGPGGFLGAPTTDSIRAGDGRAVVFVKGRIYWGRSTGAHVVYGAILARYLEEGGPRGRLGLPTSDEYAWKGRRRSDFQEGYITWTSSGGTKVVAR